MDDPLHEIAVREPQVSDDDALIREIAMDIGKETVAYVEVMFPEVMTAARGSFNLSLQNHIFNEIMAAIKLSDAGEVEARLRDRKTFRRRWTKAWRDIRRSDPRPDERDR